MDKEVIINEALVHKVIKIVDAGLCKGVGVPKPGQMCVEAAVSYAMGLPHGDNPSCVGRAVRSFKIRLNDSNWSSDAARAKGMRKVAVAQLGSNKIDQRKFVDLVALDTIKQIVPIAMREAAKVYPKHASALEASALACEIVTTLSEGRAAAQQAKKIARMAAGAYAAYATAYAAYATAYAADATAYAADAAAAADAADAAADVATTAADAAAAADAADAAYATKTTRDKILTISAEICLKALITLGTEGCKFLPLVSKDCYP